MTREQAGELVDRLMAAFDKRLRPETAAIYIEFLEKQPYYVTKLAVDKCIENERYFPHIGTIRKYVQESTFEGEPNADAYSTDRRKPWHRRENGDIDFGIWRQDQIQAMSDELYWQYLFDADFKVRQEEEWRRQWQGRHAGVMVR